MEFLAEEAETAGLGSELVDTDKEGKIETVKRNDK